MEPIKLEGMNRRLSPLKNWNPEVDGECGELWVFAQVPTGGSLSMTSAWKPNQEELDALYFGGASVALTVYGSLVPPMAVGVFASEEGTARTPPSAPVGVEGVGYEKARELLAAAYSDAGCFSVADRLLRTAYVRDAKEVVALRAIEMALAQQPGGKS